MEGIVKFSDWKKLDLRVAEIKSVEGIEGADKLWKITLDAGKELGERTICAGIKEHYSKEELIGKKIVYFSNLEPKKMRGVQSDGMLLAVVSEDESEVILLVPEKDIKLGGRIS